MAPGRRSGELHVMVHHVVTHHALVHHVVMVHHMMVPHHHALVHHIGFGNSRHTRHRSNQKYRSDRLLEHDLSSRTRVARVSFYVLERMLVAGRRGVRPGVLQRSHLPSQATSVGLVVAETAIPVRAIAVAASVAIPVTVGKFLVVNIIE